MTVGVGLADTPRFLPFQPAHVDMILAGTKTQTTRSRHRMDSRWQPGTRIRVWKAGRPACEIVVTQILAKRLGDLDADDARREGGYSLEEFQRVWRRLHRHRWDPAAQVLVLQFRVVRILGEGGIAIDGHRPEGFA
jgi:hypothetical protein